MSHRVSNNQGRGKGSALDGQGVLFHSGQPAGARRERPEPVTVRPRVSEGVRELWGNDDVARYLNVPKQTIYSWRKTGYGPRAIRVGKHLRWRAAVVVEWTLEQERR
jgi:predicted DNA-binding transcriptional regulator AlpA